MRLGEDRPASGGPGQSDGSTLGQRGQVQHAVQEQDDLEGAPGRQVEGGQRLQVWGRGAPPQVTQVLYGPGQSAPC